MSDSTGTELDLATGRMIEHTEMRHQVAPPDGSAGRTRKREKPRWFQVSP